ncbi:hypothetical protein I7I51_02684, partial [Histoplasma capsulatum]
MATLSLSVDPISREEIAEFSDTSPISSLHSTPTLPPDSTLSGPSTVNQHRMGVHDKLTIEQAPNENGQKHKGKGKEPNKIRLPPVPMSRYTRVSVAKYITNNRSDDTYYKVFGVIRGSSGSHGSPEHQLAANAKATEMIVNHDMNDLNREQKKIVQSARKKWKAAFNKAKQDHPEMLNAFKTMEVSPLWFVTDYHKEMHARALPLLQELCNARDENDKFLNIANMRIDSSPPQHLIEIIDHIHQMNNHLDALNVQNGVYSEAGKIPLEALEEQWELTINNNEGGNLRDLVKDFQLPAALLSVPPSGLLYYEDQDEEHKYYQSHWASLTPHVEALMQSYSSEENIPLAKSMFVNYTNDMNERIRRENTKRGQVEYLHLLDPDYLFSGLEAIAAKYHNGDITGYDDMRTKIRSLRGYERIGTSDGPTRESTTNQPSRGRRPHHVPIPSRRVVRSIRPGYASNGERVVSAQVYGTTGRCVTRDEAGNYYLRTAAEAGGRPVIEAALRHGVPTIESQGWKSLRPNLANMGEYGIEWVASAEWDKFSRRLPNIVIGFFHHNQGRYQLVAGSRSSVAELLSIRVVDRLIAEAMGHDDLTLEEIFENAYGVTHHEREQHWRNNPCIRCCPVR